jgi:ABC-type molybdate transport system substrate-binding protein
MKNKYRLIIPIILISVILIISFTSCAGNAVSSLPSQTASASLTSSPTTSQLRGKEISVFAGSASKPALDEAASVFEKQTGIKFT